MAPISVGIDLGQSNIRVCGLVLTKHIVAEGTKDIKVNGLRAPSSGQVVEVFNDANQVLKSSFGASNFQAAVVVVPNSTSNGNREAITGAAGAAGFNIAGVINERTAVGAAYVDKVKPNLEKLLGIVSVTGGVLDVSIISVNADFEFVVVAEETHLEPIDFDEPKAGQSKLSGPGGLIGLAVKILVVDPLDEVFDIAKKLVSPVGEVVLVGKASKTEKLKEAVKNRFPNARVWSPEGIDAEEVAAYGAWVIAYKNKPLYYEESLHLGNENLDAAEEKDGEEEDDNILGSVLGSAAETEPT